jgi:divalent metal cation (Fe/Co/Zn/Cd) transporter
MAIDTATRAYDLQRGIFLEYLTIAWNILEGCVAVASGVVAGSIALMGFGIDSFIETSSGGILLWRLHAERCGADVEKLERKALRLVGLSFLLLAAYIAVDSIKSLVEKARPERSPIGIGITMLSLVVMPWLAYQKRKAAGRLRSVALQADSRQTSLCAYLSAILLVGLAMNAVLGWWWADPVAALVMVPIIAREAVEAFRGKSCGDCS